EVYRGIPTRTSTRLLSALALTDRPSSPTSAIMSPRGLEEHTPRSSLTPHGEGWLCALGCRSYDARLRPSPPPDLEPPPQRRPEQGAAGDACASPARRWGDELRRRAIR